MPEASVGRQPSTSAAASAAASLGWARQMRQSSPPPQPTPSAQRAAAAAPTLEKRFPARPRAGSAGSRTVSMTDQNAVASAKAALLAAGAVDKRQPSATTSTTASWGNSAATQAFKANLSSRTPAVVGDDTDKAARLSGKSLLAAREAMSSTSRPRSASTPIPRPRTATDAGSVLPSPSAAAASALSAATIAHRSPPPATAQVHDAGAIPVVAMARKMYTSSPPVSIEVEEQKATESRHASAVAMARTIYIQQQRMMDAAANAHSQSGAYTHNDTDTVISDRAEGSILSNPVTLQEAAYTLAQERLKKLQEEIERNKEQRGNLGNLGSPSLPPQHRFGGLGGGRRFRSTSLGQPSGSSGTRPTPAAIQEPSADEVKRDRNRNALVMEAARRNVRQRLRGMDEQMAEAARIAPPSKSDWKTRAHALAQARFESSQGQRGKLDLGGGMQISQSEIDAIAARRVQPLLDHLEEKAKAERERLDIARAEQEAKKQEQGRLRAQERELREANRKARAKKAQERQGDSRPAGDGPRSPRGLERLLIKRPIVVDTNAGIRSGRDGPNSADEAASPTSKVKSWLRTRLAIRKDPEDGDETAAAAAAAPGAENKSFIGGKALADSRANANKINTTDATDTTNVDADDPALPSPQPLSQTSTPNPPALLSPQPLHSHPITPAVLASLPSSSTPARLELPGTAPDPLGLRSISPLSAAETPLPETPPARQVADPIATAAAGVVPAKGPASPGRDSRFREIF